MFERYLEPKEFQVNLELCKKDFRSDWDAISMGFSAHDSLPPSFAEFLLAEVGGKVAESVETQIWQGDYIQGSQEDQFDGVSSQELKMI